MTTQTRIGLALVGIVVLIAAAALLDGTSGDDQSIPATGGGAVTPATGTGGLTQKAPSQTAGVVDPGPLLVPGKITKLRFEKGDTVRFRARSQAADQLHVHGYDRTVELPAGKSVKVSFKATLDGVFEIELHHAGQQIGELRVTP